MLNQAGLELEGGEGRRGAVHEKGRLARGDACGRYEVLELVGEVDDVVVSSRPAFERAMFGDHDES